MKWITDKSQIKNGYVFKYENEYYLKVGSRAVKINYGNTTFKLFKNIDESKIEQVFRASGKPLIEE